MQYGSPKSVGNIVNVAINSIELRLDLLLLPAVYVGIVSLPTYLGKPRLKSPRLLWICKRPIAHYPMSSFGQGAPTKQPPC